MDSKKSRNTYKSNEINICNEYKRGDRTLLQIAIIYNTTKETVRQILKKYGILRKDDL